MNCRHFDLHVDRQDRGHVGEHDSGRPWSVQIRTECDWDVDTRRLCRVPWSGEPAASLVPSRAKRCLCQSWKCCCGNQRVSASRMAAGRKSAPRWMPETTNWIPSRAKCVCDHASCTFWHQWPMRNRAARGHDNDLGAKGHMAANQIREGRAQLGYREAIRFLMTQPHLVLLELCFRSHRGRNRREGARLVGLWRKRPLIAGKGPLRAANHWAVPPAGSRGTTKLVCTETRIENVAKKSEGAGTRTQDLRIKSPLLYQLSYAFVSVPSIACRPLCNNRPARPFRCFDAKVWPVQFQQCD
jgi:hypothetical protein